MADERLTIVDLRRLIADQANVEEAVVGQFLSALFPSIVDGLRTDKTVRIYGLGTFKLQWVEPRKSVNVTTGEPIIIEGYQKLSFTPEQSVKERVNEPFSNLYPVELDEEGKALPQQKRAPIDPLQKMGEQAEEIKDLLEEIGSTDTTENVENETTSVEAQEKQPEQQENTDAGENGATETELVKEAEASEEKAVTTESENQENKSSNKTKGKEKPYRPWLVAMVTVLLFCGALVGGYFYLQYKVEQYANELNEKMEKKEEAPVVFGVEPLDEAMEEEDSVIEELDSLLKEENDIIEAVKKVAENKDMTANLEQTAEKVSEQQVQVVNINDAKKRKKTTNNIASQTEVTLPSQMKTAALRVEKPNVKEFQKKREYSEYIGVETVVAGSRLTWIAKKYYGEKDLWVYIYEANRDVLKNPESVRPGMHLRIPKLPKEVMNMHDEANRAFVKSLQDEYLGK